MDANDAVGNGLCFPYDVLLDILGRLPGRALAASCRLVCRSWRGMIDAHSLLLPHVFPREFPGIFARYYGFETDSALIGPPRHRRRPLFWDDWYSVTKHHCNGLFLVIERYEYSPGAWNVYVCNPATLRYARLPCRPPLPGTCGMDEDVFLAFDPAVSRHHEVFYFNRQKMRQSEPGTGRHGKIDPEGPSSIDSEQLFLPGLFGEQQLESRPEEPAGTGPEVPEKEVLHVSVFSSRTGEWESREFMPGRCTSRHLYDVVTAPRGEQARRHSGVLMILDCSEGTYNMVQLPGHPYHDKDLPSYALPKRYVLASYERGICYVVLNEFELKVWELTELAGSQLGWTLAHETNLEAQNRTVDYLRENQKMQPRMAWEVVESNIGLITLFEGENIDGSNDVDGDDGTEKEDEEDNYDEAHAEEEEEQDNVDDTRSEEDEEQDGDKEEERDNIGDTQSEEEEEQDSGDEDGQLWSDTSSEYSWDSDEHNFIDFEKSHWRHTHLALGGQDRRIPSVQGCAPPKIK